MRVLGISGFLNTISDVVVPDVPRAFFHDASAAIVCDGEILVAMEEERLSRVKHTNLFPVRAIRACLDFVGDSLAQMDRIAYFFAEQFVDREIMRLRARDHRVPSLQVRKRINAILGEEFGSDVSDRLEFVAHHRAHASSVFVQSGLESGLVAVLDGNGEAEGISIFEGTRSGLELRKSYPRSRSLGHFYSRVTEFLGYGAFEEYKVMGMASYGDPERFQNVFRSIFKLGPNGEFELDHERVWSGLHAAGLNPRVPGGDVTAVHHDLAAAAQRALEEVSTHVLTHWAEVLGRFRLCLSGGVAHNSSMNGRLAQLGRFDAIYVDPAADDSGSSIGAAQAVEIAARGMASRRPRCRTVYCGPSWGGAAELARATEVWGDSLHMVKLEDRVAQTADLLQRGSVLGWMQGRSEFGPRSLGNRSILAHPGPLGNKDRINIAVKKREQYRPFAPAVTEEAAQEYFVLPPSARDLEFMSFVVDVRLAERHRIAAVTHVDGSARVQVVGRDTNPTFWRLLRAFGRRTGTPVLLNTSFNSYAEPIVQSAADAVRTLLTTALDQVVIGDYLVSRGSAPVSVSSSRAVPVATTIVEQVWAADPTVDGEFIQTCTIRQFDEPTRRRRLSPEAMRALLTGLTVSDVVDDARMADVTNELLRLWEARLIEIVPPKAR